MWFQKALLNSKSDKLDPNIIVGRIHQRPITSFLEAKSTEQEVTVVLRSMAKAKAVGPDELPMELLNLRLRHDSALLRSSPCDQCGAKEKKRNGSETTWSNFCINKMIGQSAGTTAVYHLSHSRERFSSRPSLQISVRSNEWGGREWVS